MVSSGASGPMADPSSWYQATARGAVSCPPLAGAVDTDACVVGGGYTGLSAALHMAGAGFRVVLLEARQPGFGASGRNGGQVGTGQRREEEYLEARFGPAVARDLFRMAEDSKALVRSLITRHGIDCDLRPGQIIAAARPGHLDDLCRRAERLARDYDYPHQSVLTRSELRERVATDGYHGGILDTGAFHLHPLNYALGLAAAARTAGATLYGDSRVLGWDGDGGDRITVRTAAGQVRCRFLLLACNGYLEGLSPALAARILPINNYLLATEPLTRQGSHVLRDQVCVHDTRFVVNYFRPTPDGRLVFGGGETYGRGFPSDLRSFVRRHLLKVFPQLDRVVITHAWGGTLAITMSRLPHLGRLAPNVFFAQGFSGHGIAMGTLAGQLMAEAVAGTAGRFDLLAGRPPTPFPGGALLRRPAAVLGMLWYALRDRL
jgi:gamma-glutamylputrescine oxidase